MDPYPPRKLTPAIGVDKWTDEESQRKSSCLQRRKASEICRNGLALPYLRNWQGHGIQERVEICRESNCKSELKGLNTGH
jgi:hypothetical protein